jgi:hypothetical protein
VPLSPHYFCLEALPLVRQLSLAHVIKDKVLYRQLVRR